MNELVSIITPSYNSEKFISDTIKSVQNQTYTNWEMIIVDDCSTDKTVEIIQNFMDDDNRVHLIKLNKNSGTGIARNTALQEANGRYIAFLDSDDLWKPEKLSKQIDFMETNYLIFTFSAYDCIDEDGKPLNKRVGVFEKLTYRQLFFCNFVGNLTGIYDSKYTEKIPISPARKRQDWILWLIVIKRLNYAKSCPESLAFYRVRKNAISASKISLLKENYAVYRKHHKLNVVVSLLCMVVFLFTQLIIKPRYTKKITPSM
jgi:teichuronic acid biosynthesis glycosyltransferase TuaG